MRLIRGSFVITSMILKAEDGKRALKPFCKTVQFVASFSTLWPAVGSANQMKAWSTDSPHLLSTLLCYKQIAKEVPLCSSPFLCSRLQSDRQHLSARKVACYLGGLNTLCVHSCCPMTQLIYLSICETFCEIKCHWKGELSLLTSAVRC